MERATIVGEANPYGGRPEYALFPRPINSAGWRLCHKVLGVTEEVYLSCFRRTNIFETPPKRWDPSLAERRARSVLDETEALGINVVVSLGRRVAEALLRADSSGLHRAMTGASVPWAAIAYCGVVLVALPHPSGRCHAWNMPGMYDRCRGMLQTVIPDVRFGGA